MNTADARRARRRPGKRPPPLALHVLLYPDDGAITAECLETGVASCGATPAEAVAMFDEAAQALFAAIAADPDAASPFERPAPASRWRSLRDAVLTDASPVPLEGYGPVPRLAYLADESPDA